MRTSEAELRRCRDAGMSLAEVSRHLGVGHSTARRALTAYGISLRKGHCEDAHVTELRNQVRGMAADEAVEYLLTVLESLVPSRANLDAWELDGIHLTRQEKRLLFALDQRRGRTVSKDTLLSAIAADRRDADWPEIKIVDVLVCKLRRKIAGLPLRIETAWGMGYRLVVEDGFAFPWEDGANA